MNKIQYILFAILQSVVITLLFIELGIDKEKAILLGIITFLTLDFIDNTMRLWVKNKKIKDFINAYGDWDESNNRI